MVGCRYYVLKAFALGEPNLPITAFSGIQEHAADTTTMDQQVMGLQMATDQSWVCR